MCSFVAQPASAHVLVTDSSGSLGAVLHIIPDDDPIAGEKSTLFFDIQNGDFKEEPKIEVEISSEDNKKIIPMKTDGSLATVDFVFPVQGQYELTFTADSSAKSYTFTHTQRVTRGVASSVLDAQRHVWAEMILVGCFTAFAIGCIVAWNRRDAIRRASTF